MSDGFVIPPGTIINYNQEGLHFNTDQWKEPESFIPERFDPESEWYSRPDCGKRSPLAFLPFSFGPRQCPGQSFALLELKVMEICVV